MLDKATHDYFKIFHEHITELQNKKNQNENQKTNSNIGQNRLILNASCFIFTSKLHTNDDMEVLSNYLIWSFNHLFNFSVTGCNDDE